MLDARDPGELVEHATLTEATFDRRTLGIDTLFIVGDELFGYLFRPENGWGGGAADRGAIDYTPRLRRVHRGPAGGPDAFGCFSCHFEGRARRRRHADAERVPARRRRADRRRGSAQSAASPRSRSGRAASRAR